MSDDFWVICDPGWTSGISVIIKSNFGYFRGPYFDDVSHSYFHRDNQLRVKKARI